MPVQLNHTIVRVRDKHEAAGFFADILGLPPATTYGPFQVLKMSNGVSSTSPTTMATRSPPTTHFSSAKPNSTRSSAASAIAGWTIGLTRSIISLARSIPMTAVAESTGPIRTDIHWRSSLALLQRCVNLSGMAMVLENRLMPGHLARHSAEAGFQHEA